MTALVRHSEPQKQDLKKVLERAEFVAKRESRLKTTLTVVVSINVAIAFGAITLAALLLNN